MHFHSAIFGGLSAWLLEGAASYPFLTRKIGDVLDSMFTVGVPKEWHVGHLLKKTVSKSYGLKDYTPPSILLTCSLPTKNKKEFKMHLHKCQCTTQVHEHSFTCHLGVQGKLFCRLCKPSGLVEKTIPVQLISDGDGGYKIQLPEEKDHTMGRDRDISIQPIPPPDSRCIVWELSRRHPLPLPDKADENCSW